MKISFLSQETNINIGSYRIYIDQFANQIKSTGIEVHKSTQIDQVATSSDCIIIGKNNLNLLQDVLKSKKPNQLIGIVHPPLDTKITGDFDFIIVGSTLEKVYAKQFYDNIFVYDLIEDRYNNIDLKVHKNKSELIVGTHGNHVHLYKYIDILKTINQWEYSNTLKFINITDSVSKSEKILKNLKLNFEIEHIKWNLDSFTDDLKKIDIAIVATLFQKKIKFKNFRKGKYKSDYSFRFKSNTNQGRAFVFYQLGIPVIEDLSPESFSLNFKEDSSLFYHSDKSLIKNLNKLKNADFRDKLSKNANKKFQETFLTKNIAEDFINFLDTI